MTGFELWRTAAHALAIAGVLSLATAPASAQDEEAPAPEAETLDAAVEEQGAKDVAFLRECLDTLAARGAPARVCIDIVARQCGAEPDGATTAGAMACEVRESEAWQALLGEAAQALEVGMSNTERERFATAQDAWASFRDAQCAYEAALYDGEAQQEVERTACVRGLTAERTIGLHERSADAEERAEGR